MLSREIQPIYLYLLQLTMNLAGISYLTFSHILTTYPSLAKHNNCSKTITIMLPPGRVTTFSSPPPYTQQKPSSPWSPIPTFFLSLPLRAPHWPG